MVILRTDGEDAKREPKGVYKVRGRSGFTDYQPRDFSPKGTVGMGHCRHGSLRHGSLLENSPITMTAMSNSECVSLLKCSATGDMYVSPPVCEDKPMTAWSG